MAQPSSPFEAMPLELHANVLSHMSTPQDVLASIRASSALLRAFMTGPERIYAAALEAAVAPEVFRELLAIVHARDHNKCPDIGPLRSATESQEDYDSIVDEWNAWWENANCFLQDHACGAAYCTPDVKMGVTKFHTQVRFMVKLYFCLSKFVNFYPTFVRSNAAQIWPISIPPNGLGQQVQESQTWPRLTDTEQLRLQRGLLRYELCCRLSGLPSTVCSCDPTVHDSVLNDTFKMDWLSFPYTCSLPVDEVEEIMCASTYVRDLYESLRFTFSEELCNHIPELEQGGGDSLAAKDSNNTSKKTAGDWLSPSGRDTLLLSSLRPWDICPWTETMHRLGFVFLDRVTRSSPGECRELFRGVFNAIFHGRDSGIPWRYWDGAKYAYLPRPGKGLTFEGGPHCNSLIKTAGSNRSIAQTIARCQAFRRLHSLGWAFFDDKTKLRSLGLPHDPTVFSILDWIQKAMMERSYRPAVKPGLYQWACSARFTEEEWEELGLQKYSLKDYCEDYKALSQFAAGARAVVDFTSNHLPHID